jgi:hypothetical protein
MQSQLPFYAPLTLQHIIKAIFLSINTEEEIGIHGFQASARNFHPDLSHLILFEVCEGKSLVCICGVMR